jgi:hypothetical protein
VTRFEVAVVATYAANDDILHLRRALRAWSSEGPDRRVVAHDGDFPGWTVVTTYETEDANGSASARRDALMAFADDCDRSGLQGAAAIFAYVHARRDSGSGGQSRRASLLSALEMVALTSFTPVAALTPV